MSIVNPSHFYVAKYYEVSDTVLGRGSFSTVYLARHTTFGTKVALKVINRKEIKEEYVNRNLHREARILMKLNHPNIVNFYEEVSQKELYCLSMEYVRGVDLSQHLKKQEAFRVSEYTARTLFFQIVSAVDHMHRNNILHRDLKQENILLEHGRVIKIVDFGLSNVYQPNVRLRTHCGSMVYAAPELFQYWSVYGAGVDLWSLGVILYAMVVGRMPFELSKRSKDIPSHERKDLFLKRILQGLTGENWEQMKMLSLDCCNLIQNLLQPDQFKRMHIRLAKNHPWFRKDFDLQRRLPQHRADLREKLTPQIIDFMADKLGQSRERVRMHVKYYKFDRISSIFYNLQDTLMKDIIYPPKDIASSFLRQFELWRRSRNNKENENKKNTETVNGNLMLHSTRQYRLNINKKFADNTEHSLVEPHGTRKNSSDLTEVESSDNNNIKGMGDGKTNSKSPTDSCGKKSTNEFVPNGTKTNNLTPSLNYDYKQGIQLASDASAKRLPIKSYKNSRPNKGMARAVSNALGENSKMNDSDVVEELGNNQQKSSNILSHSISNDKLISMNSKVKNFYKISNHRINETKDKNGRYIRKTTGKDVYSDVLTRKEVELKNQPASYRKFLDTKPTSSIRTNDSTTSKPQQFTQKIRRNSNFPDEVPEKNQSYLQRNIIISRADKGCGRVYYNSKIPMKNMPCTPEEFGKAPFSNMRKSRNYDASDFSADLKKS